MKKTVVLALGACMLIATADAQPFKQVGGEKNLQVLFAPLGGQPISINGISFRKFNDTGTGAWRLNLFIGMTNNTDINIQAGDMDNFPTADTSFSFGTGADTVITTHGSNPQGEKNTKTFTFSIRPGYEKHFAGTDRLSPYVGAELLFSKTTSTVTEDQIQRNPATPAYNSYDSLTSQTISAPYTVYSLESKNHKDDGAATTFGINLIAGFDFYFAKNLSLGAEMGFGFSTTSYPDYESQELKSTASTADYVPFNPLTNTQGYETHTASSYAITDKPAEKQGKSSQLGSNVVAQIKLGWLF